MSRSNVQIIQFNIVTNTIQTCNISAIIIAIIIYRYIRHRTRIITDGVQSCVSSILPFHLLHSKPAVRTTVERVVFSTSQKRRDSFVGRSEGSLVTGDDTKVTEG